MIIEYRTEWHRQRVRSPMPGRWTSLSTRYGYLATYLVDALDEVALLHQRVVVIEDCDLSGNWSEREHYPSRTPCLAMPIASDHASGVPTVR